MVSRKSLPPLLLAIGLGALLPAACTETSESPLSPQSLESAAVIAGETLTIPIQVSPAMLVLDGPGVWVTVHADVAFSNVDLDADLEVNGVPAVSAFPDNRGDLVVKVYQSDIEELVAPPTAIITLTGYLESGTAFSGSRQISVKESAR